MAEGDAAALALPEAAAVGPAVRDQVVHQLDGGQELTGRQPDVDGCGDSAH